MASQQNCTLPFGREPSFPILLCLLMMPRKMYLSAFITATSIHATDIITCTGLLLLLLNASSSQLIVSVTKRLDLAVRPPVAF